MMRRCLLMFTMFIGAMALGAPPKGGAEGGGAGRGGGGAPPAMPGAGSKDAEKPSDEKKPTTDPAELMEGTPYPREWFVGNAKDRERHAGYHNKKLPETFPEGWEPSSASMADLENKIGIFVLFRTYEESSISALKTVSAICDRYKDKPLAAAAIATEKFQERSAKVAQEQKLSFGVAHDDDDVQTYRSFDAKVFPLICVVDKSGNVRAMGLKQKYVENVVVALLKDFGDLPKDYVIPPPSAQGAATPPAAPPTDPNAKINGITRKWLKGSDASRARLAEIDNKPPPGLHGAQWLNSQPVGLENFPGKVVLIHFFNASNGVSIATLGKTQEMSGKYKDQGLEVIGICATKAAANMEKIVEARGVKFPCAADAEDATARAFKVEGSGDSFYFVDRAGKLRAADCDKASVEEIIKLLLAEKAKAPSGGKGPSRSG